MASDGKKHEVAGRTQTDESLRTERDKADRAVADQRASANSHADSQLGRARADADHVQHENRAKEDQEIDRASPNTGTMAILNRGRETADQMLYAERASADEALKRERNESSRVLDKLLPLERAKTDRYLLTERARSDEAVANRDGFLGLVCHDLRNLLAGIVISAELLSEGESNEAPGEQTRVGTSRIQSYAARMSRLIEDLLDVASVDAGHLAVTLTEDSELGAVIEETVDAFQSAVTKAGHTIESTIIGAPLRGTFDQGRILQVLANIVSNAIKFTPRGGQISIKAERTSDALLVSVRDTGVGISADGIGQVFERFWQIGPNDRRGSGLGLYISKCLVEAHGGEIQVTSNEGEGSVFSFTIPSSSSVSAVGA